MNRLDKTGKETIVSIDAVEPYDFELSLRVNRSFLPKSEAEDKTFHIAVEKDNTPIMITISKDQATRNNTVAAADPEIEEAFLKKTVKWVLSTELDLSPFYGLINNDAKLDSIIMPLHGLKPFRPASLFEMAVVAITEQQISLSAAFHIRSRVVERFGMPLKSEWIFPDANRLANARVEDLRSCGLSKQKAQYIHELSGNIARGELDLDDLKRMNDDQARETIMNWRGFGAWSANYILVRGLARPDCVPIDDLAVRSMIGKYLGNGSRVSSSVVEDLLKPYKPYRGNLSFYLLAYDRLHSSIVFPYNFNQTSTGLFR
jgi:DNA-3-methyladenine glycosylase II